MIVEPDRLLVVDDNRVNRMVLIHSLQEQGRCVDSAVNGRVALDLLRSTPFDLVLLDIEMPEMDGYQVLSVMKNDAQLRHIPVIMVTAVDEIESAIRCIEMGAEDYLPKPFNPVLLRARIGASLDKKHLRDREQLYLQSLEREMEIGREIQAGFLPTMLPQVPGWEISANLKSAKKVAGDFYDVFLLESEQKICLVIADVCDKGVGAALFMTLFRSLLRFTMLATDTLREGTIADKLRYAATLTNDYIAETHGDTGMFATIFLGLLDPADGRLAYINAGHEHPLIINSKGECRDLKNTGPAVGVIPGVNFAVQETQLQPGELFFAFTDGVPDSLDPAEKRFGRERVFSLLENPSSAQAVLDSVFRQLTEYMGTAEQFDDITLLVVRRLHQTL